MSDDQPKKRKGGRPKGVESGLLNQKRRQYSYGLMERIRERIDPDVLIDFHLAILKGQNPIVEEYANTHRVIPDPSPLSPSPTLEQKAQSAKWLTDRGHGLPVQSTMVDIEVRHRLDQMGSGLSNQALESMINPRALKLLQQALKPDIDDNAQTHDAIDAEFTETNKNNPLPVSDSG